MVFSVGIRPSGHLGGRRGGSGVESFARVYIHT